MAEERTLGLARAYDQSGDGEEPSKEALQRRMEEARESITTTVTEIKENVAQQYDSVKDALDWREHFKKQPVAWSLGAAGVGFFVGYGVVAAIKGDDKDTTHAQYSSEYSPRAYAEPILGEAGTGGASLESAKTNISARINGKDAGPGVLERFRETSAYEKLSKEAGALGDRLVEELSTTAQQVVLPALLKKIKHWIGLDLSEKSATMGKPHETRNAASEPSLSR